MGGPTMWFNRVPEPKTAKNRLHFDLRASGMLADEVRRLTNLGSSWFMRMKTSWSCRIPTETSSVSSSRSDGRSAIGDPPASPSGTRWAVVFGTSTWTNIRIDACRPLRPREFPGPRTHTG